ncbi:MAG TPA: sugar ABC transporter substrate-binding protein [Thermoanaerobacterales bacterium]|nr:sugar ABC transporter substrate-binding protein [Thermoanaerobacterales bacterium]
MLKYKNNFEKECSKVKRFLSLLLVVLLVATVIAGCGQNKQPAETPIEQGQETSEKPAEKIKIGFSFPTKNNEFWKKSLDFVEFAAKELEVEVIAQDCDNKQEKQINDVDNMISAGISGLVLAPQDASVCPGIVNKCKEKGIPVMIADRWPGDELKAGVDYLGFIGPNDVQAGYDIAMALINGGAKNIVAIGGFAGTSVAEGRKEGLMKAIEENKDKDVKLLQYEAAGENMDQGDKALRNMLQANSDIDGVWCYNDSHALASVNILKEKNLLSKVKVGGMDLLNPAIESIEKGELYFSTGGHYMQTGFALIMVYDAVNGKDPTESLVKLNLLNVTKDNIDIFKSKYIESTAPVNIKEMSRVFNPDAKTYFELSLDN